MSQAETPAITDIDRLILAQEETQAKVEALIEAVNGLGANIQWVIDNAKGIFQMFSSPQFMAQLPHMMGGNTDGE